MTGHLDVDRALDEWLAEGPSQLPERAIDGIVRQLNETKQRRPTWLPGRERMNRTMLAIGGVAAAAVFTIVAAGLYFGSNVDAPGVGGAPTPTASPTQAPAALPQGEAQIEPGRYFTDVQGYRYTFSVSGVGWTSVGNPFTGAGTRVVKGDHEADPPDFGGLFLWGTTGPSPTVYAEPCQWAGTAITPGPTSEDLANALAALDGFEASEPADVIIGGHQGKRLQLTVPDDVNFADCQAGKYQSIDGRWYQVPGQIDDIRIVDLDGTRQYFFTTYDPGTPAETRTQLEQMVESLEIERVGD